MTSKHMELYSLGDHIMMSIKGTVNQKKNEIPPFTCSKQNDQNSID